MVMNMKDVPTLDTLAHVQSFIEVNSSQPRHLIRLVERWTQSKLILGESED